MSDVRQLELVVVMPVYNEEQCIRRVVESWIGVLSAQGISFRVLVLNDGSRDGTAKALEAFSGHPQVEVINKPNSGHGPTILIGYRKAVGLAQWTFQCDSDDEMPAQHFPSLWRQRDSYDALFGYRQGRQQDAGRRLISVCSRATVRCLFGSGVRDVNTPYRLMRSSWLRPIVDQIPQTTFAPNLIISGAFSRAKARICNVPVPHEGRKTGSVSLVKWKLWRGAIRSFYQTLKCRPKIDPCAVRRGPHGQAVQSG
jgi:dolichol-phosphate mannosyltransferase